MLASRKDVEQPLISAMTLGGAVGGAVGGYGGGCGGSGAVDGTNGLLLGLHGCCTVVVVVVSVLTHLGLGLAALSPTSSDSAVSLFAAVPHLVAGLLDVFDGCERWICSWY